MNRPPPPIARRPPPLVVALAACAFAVTGLLFAGSDPVASESVGRTATPSVESAGAPRRLPATLDSTDRVIVRMRGGAGPLEPSPDPGRRMAMSAGRAQSLATAAVADLTPVRVMGDGAHVLRLAGRMRVADVQAIVERLERHPAVESAQPDRIKFPMQAPSDGRFASQQWNLANAAGGINAPGAWSQGIFGQGVIVAVVDTGIVQTNRDLTLPATRLVSGYDFISADRGGVFATANDGDGRDADPSDPGNWISSAEAGQFPFEQCRNAQTSDWHGTHTAGIIAANANNDAQVGQTSVVGIAYQALIQPIRALGKCGGYTSDIADGIRWAAGIAVAGVPANPSGRAQVINLSLGSTEPCSAADQSVINDALAAGVKAIVAAAGNEDGADAKDVAPANCNGVIAVAATDRFGNRAPYSNIGSTVAISAPGGCFDTVAGIGFKCANTPQSSASGIVSTSNAGTTVPSTNDSYVSVIGTSEAAAHVSAVAALMVAANTSITSTQLRTLLTGSARPFPTCSCARAACGAGIVDAEAAVRSVLAGSVQASTGTPASCAGSSVIAGSVFFDADRNGVRAPSESGLSGVTVILADAGGTEISRTTTSASGYYNFMSLAAGTYRLSKVQPENVSGAAATPGTAGGSGGVNTVTAITLAANAYASGYDFPLDSQTVSDGGGGGGGGGCVIGAPTRVDPLFALVAALCIAGIVTRRGRRNAAR
jgi:serine protease